MEGLDKIDAEREKELYKLEKFNDERLGLEEEYKKAEASIKKKYDDQNLQYTIKKTEQWLSAGSSALSQISSLYNQSTSNRIAELDNQQKAEEDAVNKSNLTEEQKKAKIEAIDAKYEAKKKEVQVKNAKIQKKLALFQAMIDLPLAVMKTFDEFGYPFGLIPAAMMTALGLEKIKLIRSSLYRHSHKEVLPQQHHWQFWVRGNTMKQFFL